VNGCDQQGLSMSAEVEADRILDARGLDCPQPIIQTRQAMKALNAGDTLLVLATDPGSVLDFQAYCRMSDVELLQMSESQEEYRFLMRKPV